MQLSDLSIERLSSLSPDQLRSGVLGFAGDGHRSLAGLIAYLGEVEAQRLDLESGSPSLFDYCIRRLGMSNGGAYRRITAARLARRFPGILAAIFHGEINLCALVLLRDLFRDDNVEDLLRDARGKTTREVEELVARLAPKPDVPSRIRELPSEKEPSLSLPAMEAPKERAVPAAPPQRMQPLSEGRHRIEFTASTQLRKKLERIADLMRHRNPSGDLAVMVEAMADLMLPKLEKERLGKTARARKPKTETKEGYITQEVRREVFARDGERCTFVAADGERCTSTTLLEIDHIEPSAKGGSEEASNLRVRCRAHNRLYAEKTFGREHVAERIHFRQRKSRRVKDEARPTEPSSDPFVLAEGALLQMGFRGGEVRSAIGALKHRHVDDRVRLEPAALIREALALLT